MRKIVNFDPFEVINPDPFEVFNSALSELVTFSKLVTPPLLELLILHHNYNEEASYQIQTVF